MSHKQTIKKSVSLSGIGLHTGVNTTITLTPAEDNAGISFVRTDVESRPRIKADVNNVVSTNRSTKLRQGDYDVATVEHLLSALSAHGVDNVTIEIDGPEVPIMNGSATPFYDLIAEAGVEAQASEKEYFVCTDPIMYQDDNGSEIIMMPSEHLRLKTMIDFNSPILGTQYAELDDVERYGEEIAPSKTFVFTHELLPLIDQNLIKGGDLSNALVIANEELSDEDLEKITSKIDVKQEFKREGVVNEDQLTFYNEPARHKLLDLMGDISLVGRPIKGKIVASKPGHTANVAFARLVKKELLKQKKLKDKPIYDPNVEPVYDINDIKNLIPHRFPFLLVDKVIKMEDGLVVGIKNITGNETFFQGHFPGNPIFPGVLQMEALAQTGGILALSQVEDPANWETYFIKMDKVKFKNKVVPGDTLILKMELLSPIRRGIVQMQGTAYVGDKIVSEGELTAQIVKNA